MSSEPRSLRLWKRGGGSIRRTGWGCGIILTGGWSRPPGNTSRDKTHKAKHSLILWAMFYQKCYKDSSHHHHFSDHFLSKINALPPTSVLPLGGGCGSSGWGGFWSRGAREAADSWACRREGGGAWAGTLNVVGGGSVCIMVGAAFIMLGAWGWL